MNRLAALTGRPYRVRPDSWERAPAFGFTTLADAVAKVIVSSAPQLTLAVYGEWGTGKTTLLHAVDERIRSSACPVVWFDMWEHRDRSDVAPYLLAAIADALRDSPEVSKKLRGFARAALASATLSAGQVSFSGDNFLKQIDQMWDDVPKLGRDRLAEVVELWQHDHSTSTTHLRSAASGLEPHLGNDPAPRIVVVIDNLDRCLPAQAVHMLEQTSTLFDFEGMIFLLAAERDRLAQAVEDTYQLQGEGAVYLEKLVQVEFAVPGLDHEHVVRWIESELGDSELALTGSDAELIAEATQWNPRRIKRLVNNLRMQLCSARPEFADEPDLVLGSTLLLETDATLWRELTKSAILRDRFTNREQSATGLAERIIASDGGQRLLELRDDQMSRFLTSAESTLAVSDSTEVKDAVEQARSAPEVTSRVVNLVYLGADMQLIQAFSFAGALDVLEEDGYRSQLEAGTGIGALVAALHVSNYAAAGIATVLGDDDIAQLGDELPGWRRRLGQSIDVSEITRAREEWVAGLLRKRRITTLRDWRTRRGERGFLAHGAVFAVHAVDLERDIVLPRDLAELELKDDEVSIAALVTANVWPGESTTLSGAGDGVAPRIAAPLGDPGFKLALDSEPDATGVPTFTLRFATEDADEAAADTIVIQVTPSLEDDGSGGFKLEARLYANGRRAAQEFLSARAAE